VSARLARRSVSMSAAVVYRQRYRCVQPIRSNALAIWLFPVPELPAITSPCLRPTKPSVASSMIWAFCRPLWKAKSKSARSFRSGSLESLIRRSIRRSISASASMASSLCRSSVGGSASCAAWASSVSRAFCMLISLRVLRCFLIRVRVSSGFIVFLLV